MADEFVSEERWRAGAEYLASLREHGFQPDSLFWAQNDSTQEMVLVIVSQIVDRIGSTEIYDTLFKAYDKSITPKSIDPWIVSVFGPLTIMNYDFHNMMEADIAAEIDQIIKPKDDREMIFVVAEREFSFRKSWVYVARKQNMDRRRQDWMWRKFSGNVERLAA